MLFGLSAIISFWLSLSISIALCLRLQDVNRSDALLKSFLATLLLLLAGGHFYLFLRTSMSPVAMVINVILLVIAVSLLVTSNINQKEEKLNEKTQ
ncbi:MAG: hypothetical protein GKR93_16425 [Gammaproteobacteria bacterium]|nr:hypothetical protein [Gammaproteobacteria bacterium]